jgi:hypothetical protein
MKYMTSPVGVLTRKAERTRSENAAPRHRNHVPERIRFQIVRDRLRCVRQRPCRAKQICVEELACSSSDFGYKAQSVLIRRLPIAQNRAVNRIVGKRVAERPVAVRFTDALPYPIVRVRFDSVPSVAPVMRLQAALTNKQSACAIHDGWRTMKREPL